MKKRNKPRKKTGCPCGEIGDVKPGGCAPGFVEQSLLERIKKLKHNKYMCRETWHAKNIIDMETGARYSYADIDQLFNN